MLYDAATDSLELGDSLGHPALNAATGFFCRRAVSYWSRASAFWVNNPSGTPPSASDLPDGDVVEKGPMPNPLRSAYAIDQSGRKVYTCIDCSTGTTLVGRGRGTLRKRATPPSPPPCSGPRAAPSVPRSSTGSRARITTATRRGREARPPCVPASMATFSTRAHRSSITAARSERSFITAATMECCMPWMAIASGATAGSELWTFVPQEFFGRLKRLRDDIPEIRFPNTPATSSRDATGLFRRRAAHRLSKARQRRRRRAGPAVRSDAPGRPLFVCLRCDRTRCAEILVAQDVGSHIDAWPDMVRGTRGHAQRAIAIRC